MICNWLKKIFNKGTETKTKEKTTPEKKVVKPTPKPKPTTKKPLPKQKPKLDDYETIVDERGREFKVFPFGSNVQLTKNFNSDEMDCKYGDNEKTIISIVHIEKLQKFRDYIGKPIKITSGYRNLKYNRSIRSKDTSQHVKGLATDIQVKGMTPKKVADEAGKFGFDGIGRYRVFTHLDSRGKRARWGRN